MNMNEINVLRYDKIIYCWARLDRVVWLSEQVQQL